MAGQINWDQFPDADSPAPQGSGKVDWDQFPDADQSPSLVDQASQGVISGLAKVGRAIDPYSGAPSRAAIAALVDTGSIGKAAAAAYNQFGSDPDLAPTARDIGKKLGASNAPLANTPAPVLDAATRAGRFDPYTAQAAAFMGAAKAIPRDQAVGTVVSGVADPSMYLPVGDAVEVAAGLGEKAAGGIGKSLAGAAEAGAKEATGATGAAAAKFASDAGRQLLDRGIVRFGSSPASIADRAYDALEQSGKNIGDALTQLDAKGANLPTSEVINRLRTRAAALSGKPSQFDVADGLNGLADRIEAASSGDNPALGASVPLSDAEDIKRDFQAMTNYADPAQTSVKKEAAKVYQQAVEDRATAMDPATAKVFTENKSLYKLLEPLAAASQKRALQIQQSPRGGLLDLVAAEGGGEIGALLGGGPGAVAGMAGGLAVKTLRPRFASMEAVTADQLARGAGTASGAIGALAVPAASAAGTARYAALGANYANQNPGSVPAASPNQLAQSANRTPSRGPDAWMQDGLSKLGIQDPALSQRLLSDPMGRNLLIQAHGMAGNSKAMKAIMNQIQSKWGTSQ